MATLVSPGTVVPVTDESMFIPASASTVPLLFIATGSEKLQPDGTAAAGTHEHDIVRTVTSITQSMRLYGVPSFLRDANSNPHHGDARNEYGLLALNQFLGIGNKAYVVRANVNLNDDRDSIMAMWNDKIRKSTTPVGAAYALEGLVTTFLKEYNTENGLIPSDGAYKVTVSKSELQSLIESALDVTFGKRVVGNAVWFDEATFSKLRPILLSNLTSAPLNVYADGFDQAPSGVFKGVEGEAADWVTNQEGSLEPTEWTAQEARDFMIDICQEFQYTVSFLNATTLGANDAARRVAIVEALQATINSNRNIRSEQFEYNLILCPGYHEVVDELAALAADIADEAFVIADTPMNMDPEQVVAWASTTQRKNGVGIAYYYPHGLVSNLDGMDVLAAASGIALRTYAYSDNVAQLWFAPAGTTRGLVQGVSAVGYANGTLGGAVEFEELALDQGQRDDLYTYHTNINPIVYFPGRGTLIWGQKTSAPDASARDRVNVERMIRHIKRRLRKDTMGFIFEPNDQITRDNLAAVVTNFLSDILVKRGLYDFAVRCDESNNTADRIERNEMYCDVVLKPAKAAEFLYIPIRIVNTGADVS
ncbi:Phage tail sheath protein [compost metagenome]